LPLKGYTFDNDGSVTFGKIDMCLAIPMKILKIEGDRAIVSSGGVQRSIGISFLKGPKIGDYVIVHAGFAIEKLDPVKAEETLKLLEEIE
jgi:hydrogenase expression/formation protein HypC